MGMKWVSKKKNDSAKSWHPQDFLLKVPLVVVSFCWLRNSSMSGIMSPNAFGPCQHFWWNLVVEPRFKNKKPKSMENNKSLKPTSLYISSFVGYSTSYNIIPQISPSDCWLAHVGPHFLGKPTTSLNNQERIFIAQALVPILFHLTGPRHLLCFALLKPSSLPLAWLRQLTQPVLAIGDHHLQGFFLKIGRKRGAELWRKSGPLNNTEFLVSGGVIPHWLHGHVVIVLGEVGKELVAMLILDQGLPVAQRFLGCFQIPG